MAESEDSRQRTQPDESRERKQRVQFTCMDCGKEVDREPTDIDVPGLTPQRCFQCTLEAMRHDR
jgi:DNA-directed RNA polymerase subunit RPC12/RpoP